MGIDRRMVRLLAAGAALFAASAAAAEVASMTQMFDEAMRSDVAVETFSHSEQLLPTRPVRKGDAVAPLPVSANAFPAIRFQDHGRRFDLNDYLAANRVAGLLVLSARSKPSAEERVQLDDDASSQRWRGRSARELPQPAQDG